MSERFWYRYLGFGTVEELPLDNVRPLHRTPANLPVEEARPGLKCQAKYPADGRWYLAQVNHAVAPDPELEAIMSRSSPDELRIQLYLVTFASYGNSEVLPIEYLRPRRKTSDSKSDATTSASVGTSGDGESATGEFVIPEHLRILPTDSEVDKMKKRKKIKVMKYKFKLQQYVMAGPMFIGFSRAV